MGGKNLKQRRSLGKHSMSFLRKSLHVSDGVITLDLSRQKLDSVPENISEIAREVSERYKNEECPWKEINLSFNNIKKLSEKDIKNLNHFDVVHLAGLHLPSLPPEIRFLTKPFLLNLSWTNLKALPKEIYTLTQLKSIRINWTSIPILDGAVKNLVNLMDLEVSETPFFESMYAIKENGNRPVGEHQTEVWRIKKILAKLNCEIVG